MKTIVLGLLIIMAGILLWFCTPHARNPTGIPSRAGAVMVSSNGSFPIVSGGEDMMLVRRFENVGGF